MKKLDRLGWAAGAAVVAYGVRIGVRVNDPAVLSDLPGILPPGHRPTRSRVVDHLYSLRVGRSPRPGLRRFHLLYSETVRIARSTDLHSVLRALESDLDLFIALAAPRRVFIHAGVVGWRGQAILLPGRTYSGKSTLVRALLQAGATYYSDEYAVLDPKGRVRPYHKPLSLRQTEDPLSALKRTPEQLGARRGNRPLPVGLVVVTEYKRGARWRPRPISPAQAALALLGHAVSARSQPRFTLTTLKRAVGKVPTLKGWRGPAEEVAKDVLTYLENRSA